MREKGSKRKLVDNDQSEDESAWEAKSISEHSQLLVTKEEFNLWVKEVYILAVPLIGQL